MGVTLSLYHYMYNFLTLSCLFFSEEPKFVGSYMIPDNEDRDDNKMYFFFTEKALEAENNAHTIYTRVGRLCVVRLARPWRYALFPQFTSLTSLCYIVLQFRWFFWEFHTACFDYICVPSLNLSTVHSPSLRTQLCVLL